MKNILINNFGKIVYFKDYVQITRNRDELFFTQRDEEQFSKTYNKRIVGIYRSPEGLYVVSSAVSSVEDESKNIESGRNVVINRILKLVNDYKYNIGPELRGITYVSKADLDFLYRDIYTYSNISGPLNPKTLETSVNYLDQVHDKYINKQRSIAYNYFKQQKQRSTKNSN